MPPSLRPRKGGLAAKDLSSRNNPLKPTTQPSKTTASTPTMNSSELSIIPQPRSSMASSSPEGDTSAGNNLSLISTLLQTAQAASISVVQVPANVLATLLASVKSLRHTVTTQATRLAAIESETIGTKFTLFPKLPFELRQMIWKSALQNPRIVPLRWKYDWREDDIHFNPVGPYSPLLWVTSESRREAQKLSSFRGEERHKFRTNPATDTVWMLGGMERMDDEFGEVFHRVYNSLEAMVRDCQTDIPALSLPYQFWLDCEEREVLDKLMEILGRLRTEEVILVIGDENFARRPDLVFIAPRDSPGKLLLKNDYLYLWETMHGSWESTNWDNLANVHVTWVKEDLEQALHDRLDWMDDHPGEDADAAGFPDWRKWIFPRIRFVEVTTRDALRKETGSGV